MRRELSEAGVRVWETRTLADCHDELHESPASFVVLELGRQRGRGAPAAGPATAGVSRRAAGRGGRPLSGRLRMADARDGGGPFSLLPSACGPVGPTGLPTFGSSPAAAAAESDRTDLVGLALECGNRGKNEG